MKNKRIVAMIMAVMVAMSALSGCGETKDKQAKSRTNVSEKNKVEPIKDLVLSKLTSEEVTTFNIMNTETSTDKKLLINLVDGLCDTDNKSQLIPALATSWGTDDNGHTWKFKLRKNATWVDQKGKKKANVTAEDFATGMEWILNFHKNNSFNTARLVSMVDGAKEYYEYTKNLSKEEALALKSDKNSKFREMVGISTPDAHTVVYTCIGEIPYFDSISTSTSLYPMAQGMIDELGVENVNSMNNENMWYNGCYIVDTFVNGNETILKKNPLYWDKKCSLFDTVTFKVVESEDVEYSLFENGEIDYVPLGESQVKAINDDKNHKYHDYLLEALPGKTSNQMHLNFDKNLPDGSKDEVWNTAVANEAFRKSLFYGIDFTDYLKRFNPINPMKCTNDFYSRADLCYMSDGTQYVDRVREKMKMDPASDTKIAHLDEKQAEKYKKQAKEELTQKGIKFPVKMDYYIGPSQSEQDNGLVLKQCIEESLGKDFVEVNLVQFVSNFYAEVRDLSLQSFGIFGYSGAFADPSTYLCHELYNDNAWFTNKYSHIINLPEDSEVVKISKEYTRLYDEASAITDDKDKRFEAFADAEAYLLDHAITVPVYVTNSWCLSNINLNSKMYSVLSASDQKMKNWETNKNGYTREDMEKGNTNK